MELRHLRYFVAVAEEGSLTVAAERRLHTAQPSLSRQIRDLEYEVGAQLLTRSARGIELTAAGRAFLDHARMALAQTQAAVEAARRAAQPAKPSFALGFLTGQEMDWLPDAMHILKDELPNIDVTVSSDYSPRLADDLTRGKLDVAFLRPEPQMPDLAYKVVMTEPLVLVLPSDHHLASRKVIAIEDIADETFIGMSKSAPTLQAIIDDYLKRSGLTRRADRAQDRQSRHGDVARRLDARRDSPARLCAELSDLVRGEPPAQRRDAHDRPRHRLQQGEHISYFEAVPVEER
jgi:LysR family hca operon transcriptional activator